MTDLHALTGASEPADKDRVDGPDPTPVPLLELSEPLPPVVASAAALATTVAAFEAGEGPVAVDAERASGHRYFARAYLVQLRRAGAGTALVDPIPFADLSPLGAALAESEWVLHAASQDLPCLAEVGLRPRRLFDTELAGRLLNYPRVGLASLVEELLGFRLRKEHSAVDWSRRPLPEPWLRYAALDVEVLLSLRASLGAQLVAAGKQRWADEEFAALGARVAPGPRAEPWRRISGLHRVRGRRGLAVARELWQTRDEIARSRDIAAGRILPDATIADIAAGHLRGRADLATLPALRSREGRRYLSRWAGAVEAAQRLHDADLPHTGARYDGPPPARAWPERDPAAAKRLEAGREVVRTIAAQHHLPAENLLAPDALRRLAWKPPTERTPASVADRLRGHGARDWQIQLTATALADTLG